MERALGIVAEARRASGARVTGPDPHHPLDYDLIHEDPVPIYMGELPRAYEQIPAPVVVNLAGVFPPGYAAGRVVFAYTLVDLLDPDCIPERRSIERFLQAVHLHAAGTPSYWHCYAGINRSGFALAAYLHLHRGLKVSAAIELLRLRRAEMVLCNNVFERTLREWYGGPDEQDMRAFTYEIYLRERSRRADRGQGGGG